jgi:outer membrane protein W
MNPTSRLAARLAPAAVAIACGSLASLPALAQEEDHSFKIFGAASYVMPLSDSSVSGVASSVEASDELGFELGAEWKATDRIGIEVSYLDATHDVEANGAGIGEIDLRPWSFTANFHVLSRDHFSWYVGPTVSYIDWSSLELANGATLDVDGETTFGAATGVDIGIGDTFAVQLGLRWLDASVDSPSLPNAVSVDPLFARVGIALRF